MQAPNEPRGNGVASFNDGQQGQVLSLGLVRVKTLADLEAEETARAAEQNAETPITSLAAYIRRRFTYMEQARRTDCEPRMLKSLYQRRGEYDPQHKALIGRQGGTDLYLRLSSNKARAAQGWIADTVSGVEGPLPYAIDPTPVPDLPPERVKEEVTKLVTDLDSLAQLGVELPPAQMEDYVRARTRMVSSSIREEAQKATDEMKRRMDDQLVEGGADQAFKAFLADLVTFPFAMLKGPVIERHRALAWDETGTPVVEEVFKPVWKRVDPFSFYWEPHMEGPEDGDVIERHRMSRTELRNLIGVEGYNGAAILAVLEEHGQAGSSSWLSIDMERAQAAGLTEPVAPAESGLIEAYQFWGSVQGTLLREWGMSEDEVPETLEEYQIEAWLVGRWVIKAMVNPDPLRRKPYFKTSYEKIPGAWMGDSPMDLTRDAQNVCNAAARALVNNMGIASGPQVAVNIDRMPAGEKITQMYPWKIWQFLDDKMGSTAPPMSFFQPPTMAAECLTVLEKFSTLADEFSGIPRYMTGDGPMHGAARTATGMSMLMGNAGKVIKNVLANVDSDIVAPLVERLWTHNMLYSDDPALRQGDIAVRPRGAVALMVKDAAAVRRNEFLQLVLASPAVQQLVGPEGLMMLLREQAKTLDMNTDKIIPPPEVAQARAMAVQAAAQAQGPQQMPQAPQAPQAPVPQGPQPPGPIGGRERLLNGVPVADHFSPVRTP